MEARRFVRLRTRHLPLVEGGRIFKMISSLVLLRPLTSAADE
jgi:hypothetical protein